MQTTTYCTADYFYDVKQNIKKTLLEIDLLSRYQHGTTITRIKKETLYKNRSTTRFRLGPLSYGTHAKDI